MIADYKDKKLVEYLEPGMKVLIRFGHGWGDTLMFMPVYYALKLKYPEVHFDLYLENGQEDIFESYSDKNGGSEHDYVFHLDFPMSEGTGITKAEKCMISEIGEKLNLKNINPLATNYKEIESPFVAVHFQGTALPDSVNCPYGVAQQIWQEIQASDMIPIECHFKHMYHNPVNERYAFINRHVRDIAPKLKTLIRLIRNCDAFIGVASGPLMTAIYSIPNSRILFLERNHKISDYVSDDIHSININQYKAGAVKNWLKGISEQ